MFFLIFIKIVFSLTSKEKYWILLDKTLMSKSGYIEFQDSEVSQYLLQQPRNYDIVIMFTTLKCMMCKEMLPDF